MSKIAVICNTLNNYHHSKMGLDVTLNSAGMDFDLFIWDNGSDNDRIKDLVKGYKPKFLHLSEENKGNPVAYNQMLLRAYEEEYDYYVMIAPDIVLPPRWLELYYQVYSRGDLKGFLGFNWGLKQEKHIEVVNGIPLERCDYVFGCWFFGKSVLDTIGFINEEYKIYGKWDSDMNFRLNAKGISSYYLPIRCLHFTAAWMNTTEYRKMKNQWLAHNEQVHKKEVLRYAKENNYYIAPPEKIKL